MPALKEIEPCPFCGCADVEVDPPDDTADGYAVHCTECLARGPIEDTAIEAVAAWREREP